MTDLPSSAIPATATSRKSTHLTGKVQAPGDKSISHRAIMFGAIAEGQTTVSGLLEGADILSTVEAMKALGAKIDKQDDMWVIAGCGAAGLTSPDGVIDCGNAGTGVRLIMGVVAAYPITATFTGDVSLKSRPMGRILNPLRDMGVVASSKANDRLPVTIMARDTNAPLTPLDYTPPHASAQVKSAILLAGLGVSGTTIVREPTLSRDHTENMLRAFGVNVSSTPNGTGAIVSVSGPAKLSGTHVDVPGDPSSAAFPIVAALITPGSDITVKNVMMNPTRTGVFESLVEMGAYLETKNMRQSGGETIADIRVKHSELRGITVPPERAPSMIDEYPILAVAASYAKGITHMPGIKELRVKESDRIAATVALLRRNGVNISETEDSMTITGGQVSGGATVTTHHDHRIAMSALVLGLGADNPVSIDDASMIATSFPNFFDLMETMGANLEMQT